MPHSVCLLVFSTNRPEYLVRTLASQENLVFDGCKVEKFLVDDMPLNRDDKKIVQLASLANYDHIVLHKDNLGIGATWEESWKRIQGYGFDYVLQQEDDVQILEPVSVLDMIEILQSRNDLSQVTLQRQEWYQGETRSKALSDDSIYKNFRGEIPGRISYYFTPICSLYPIGITQLDYKGWFKERYPDNPELAKANINEGLIGKVLLEGFGKVSMHLKNKKGEPLINHIGEYSIGKKLLPGEPGWENFSVFDPTTKYCSRTGKLWIKEATQCTEF